MGADGRSDVTQEGIFAKIGVRSKSLMGADGRSDTLTGKYNLTAATKSKSLMEGRTYGKRRRVIRSSRRV